MSKTRTTVPKAYAYVTPPSGGSLLVFREASDPESRLQVPKGGIEPGETPRDAVVRELREEAGLTNPRTITHVATDEWPHETKPKTYRRHFFHVVVDQGRDTWRHEVTGEGADEGEVYEYHWSTPPLSLSRDMDDYVGEVLKS